METVASFFGIRPFRIGGVEALACELSRQLLAAKRRSLLVFGGEPSAQVRDYLDGENVTIEVIPDFDRRPWHSVSAVQRVLNRYSPAVSHFHFTHFLGPFTWLARMSGVKKIFFTAHGSYPEDFTARRTSAWKRALAKAINAPLERVFCVSRFCLDALAEEGLADTARLELLHESIYLPDLDQTMARGAAFRREHGIPENRPLVLLVGQIIAEKGVEDLLEAARLLGGEAHFAFVGRGRQLDEYKALSRRLGLEDRVTWTGVLANPMESGVYAAADVFAAPSRWQEAFGFVLAEAMSYERAVVATRVGGIPEVVEDGVTGLLVERRNPAALAEAIARLLRDPELRRQMGRRGRQAVERRFRLEDRVSRMIQAYGIAQPEAERLGEARDHAPGFITAK